MNTLRRLCCAALMAAACVTTGMSSAASAGSSSVTDAQQDVSAVVYGPQGVTTSQRPADAEQDIVSVDFEYRKRMALATVELGEIRGSGKNANVILRLKGGGTNLLFIRSSGNRLFGIGPESGTRCRGGSAVVDAEAKTFRFKVPARCFGAPDRVRFGVQSDRFIEGKKKLTILVDDARTTRVSRSQAAGFPRLGAAVRRG